MLEIIELTARGQSLTTNKICVASGLVNEIECRFTTDWDMDEIRAIFCNKTRSKKISVVLVNGKCNVPHEVLLDEGDVVVNLVGSVVEPSESNDVFTIDGARLVERMTSYKTKIIEVKQKVNLDGANSAPPTPEVWEQDVSRLQGEINDLDERVDALEDKPYLEKLNNYLYKVTYTELPEEAETNFSLGGCSSYVENGKLYRNLDWDYNEDKSFIVDAPNFTGMAFGSLDELNTLPYKVVDGVNKYGIKIATHILFNDFDWVGAGNIPLYKLPFIALSTMQSIDDVYDLPLSELKGVESLGDYIAQYIVTDGTTTYAILPSESGYEVVDITSNPKLTNFRWVEDETVTREMLQYRPTGVERWNLMPCALSDLRFTKAYESPTRLSEFIGINGTTKDSTDAELTAIYEQARTKYLNRTRNGETWQTMHSVVYGDEMEHLYIQENWSKDYMSSGGGGGSMNHDELEHRDYADQHPISAITGLNSALNNKADKSEIPSLDGYATEDYVDTEITRVEGEIPSLDGYATEQYVDSEVAQEVTDRNLAIANYHDATKADKSTTYTKTEVDSAISGHHDSTKQDVITDLADIRSGAEKGETALQPSALTPYRTSANQDVIDNAQNTAIGAKYTKPSSGIPKTDLASGVQTSLGLADTALQQHQSLSAYRTASAQDVIDSAKMGKDTSATEGNIAVFDDEGNAVDGRTVFAGVQVAGTDLTPTSDGKWNVPIASIGGVGAVKLNGSNWANTLMLDSSEVLQIKSPANSDIDRRYHAASYAITVQNFDYAVKQAIASVIGSGNPSKNITYTDTEKQNVWTRFTIVKSTVDTVLVAGAKYFLGTQSTLSLTLPTTAELGQQIEVVFYSGETATTLSVSGTIIGDVPTPSANNRYELNFEWDSQAWSLLYVEQSVPTE